LWGLSAEKTISTGDKSVAITMARQFAQVQVNATVSDGVIKAISNVQVKGGKQFTAFNPWSGTGTLADLTQTVSWPTISTGGAATIYGNLRLVYPVPASPVEISVGSLTINHGTDQVFSNLTAKFARTLVAGMKYTLTIAIRKLGDCGTGGDADYQMIGNNVYLTHEYGTGSNKRCWMVQNSMEGTPSSIGYGLDASGVPQDAPYSAEHIGKVNGYYYAKEQKTGACPTGWHIPSVQEATVLVDVTHYSVSSPPFYKWWYGSGGIDNGTFAGRGVNGGLYWYEWGEYGYWWNAQNHILLAHTSNVFGPDSNPTMEPAFHSVRCVQDV
jgi:uncharacterized protein (TIGR02145 family)